MNITININKRILIISIILILVIFISCQYQNNLKKELKKESDSYSVLSIMIENEDGEYEISKESSWPSEGYVFNDVLSRCENGSQISYNSDTKKVQLKSNKSDRCYVYFDIITLAEYVKGLYVTQGESGLYLHDSTLENGAGDGSYRYAGANPNNYVCFGSDEVICPDDNLYRIIGVFSDNVKLIKAKFAGEDLLGKDGDHHNGASTPKPGDESPRPYYYWNGGTKTNTWSESRLNTINLNTNYLNNIGEFWSNKIEEMNWNIGGYITDSVTVKMFYDAEKTSTYKAKMGLMTVSEYWYATLPNNWTTNISNYNGANNWMNLGNYTWTITPLSSSTSSTFYISNSGNVSTAVVNITSLFSFDAFIHPSFYLKSDVTYKSGIGTKTDPIVIN